MELLKLNIQMFADGKVVIETELDNKGIKKGLKETETDITKTGSTIKGIVAGLGITKLVSTAMNTIKTSINGAISRFDTLNNFPKVMSNLGISTEEAKKSVDKLSNGLSGLPTTLNDATLAVQRLTSVNGDVDKSTKIFLALNNAILAGGASADIQSTALEQLTQSYSKGKMDMMEWRALQTAMPAQLNQVAKAMGVTTDELGQMMREGDNTREVMDEFLDTIVKLNKKGANGFSSFSKQAKNSVNGIGTSVKNMQTSITRGVTTLITQLNKALKNNGLGGISNVINNIGKQAENLMKQVGNSLPKVVSLIKTVLDVLNKLKPIILAVVTAWVSYKTTLLAIEGINIIKSITSTVSAFVSLIPTITSAKDAMALLNLTMGANPAGIVVAGITALVAGLALLATQSSSTDKDLEKINNNLKEYDKTMKEVDKRRQETLDTNMQEVYSYQSLWEELQKITDENGKITSGYEKRAGVISKQLSDALGIEIKLTDNQIENYQELTQEINNTIEAKKAEAYLNAHQEEFDTAVKERTKLQQNYNEALKKSEESQQKYNEKLEQYSNKMGINKDILEQFLNEEIQLSDVQGEQHRILTMLTNAHAGLGYELKNSKKIMDDSILTLEKTGQKYTENSEKIFNYNQATQELANGNYEAFYKIYDDTVQFNGKTEEANNKKYENEKQNLLSYYNFLEENQDKYNKDFIEKQKQKTLEEIANLEAEKNEANKKIKEKNNLILGTTITGLNDQLKVFKDKRYEFLDAGNGNVQLYVDGLKIGQPIAMETASKLANGTIQKIKDKKMDAKQAGEFLIEGVNLGINNRSKQSSVFNSVSAFGNSLLSRLKTSLKEHSPSKATEQMGKFLMEGLNLGIDDEKVHVIKNIETFGDELINKMRNSVSLETDKMNANVQTSGTYQMAMSGLPKFNLVDNAKNTTQLVVSGKVLAEVVNTENRNREVATS